MDNSKFLTLTYKSLHVELEEMPTSEKERE